MSLSSTRPVTNPLPLEGSFLIDRITANLGAARALIVAVQLGVFARNLFVCHCAAPIDLARRRAFLPQSLEVAFPIRVIDLVMLIFDSVAMAFASSPAR